MPGSSPAPTADTSMSSCNATLTQDGDLCEGCHRSIVECLLRDPEDYNGEPQGTLSQWAHDVSSTKVCAGLGCQLCAALLLRTQDFRSSCAYSDQVDCYVLNGNTSKPAFALSIPHQTSSRSVKSYMIIDVRRLSSDGRPGFKPLSASSNSTETFSRIRDWLSICDKHTFCSRWSHINGIEKSLPTRLLEIDGSVASMNIRLVTTSDLAPDSEYSYATLSHCWGQAVNYKLTKQTLEAFHAAVSLDALPQTFRDAVETIYRLG